MSALPKINHAERRQTKRFAVVGSIPAELARESGASLRMFVQDLSRDGLGVVLNSPVRRQEKLKLISTNGKFDAVSLKVVWVRAIEDEDGTLYHCGLQSTDDSIDLEGIARSCESVSLDELD